MLAEGPNAGQPASANDGDIHFDLTAYQARCAVNAKDLPFLMYTTSTPSGQLAPLQAVVILDIEAHQGDYRLEVTPGTSCGLYSDLPSNSQQDITSTIGLYNDDASSGLFVYRGDGRNGWLATTVSLGSIAMPIDHLGIWMVANQVGSSGGCVTGQMLNACDGTRPVARHGVRANVIDSEGTRAWSAQTDQSGNYCANAPVTNYWPGMDLVAPQPPVDYFVSGTDITETAMCDPLPDGTHGAADCRTCQPALQNTSPDLRLCTNCSLTDPLPTPPASALQFADTCAAPPTLDPLRQAVLKPCSFCPGNAPATCTLSDQVPRAPLIGQCTPLATTLGYGPTASGATCRCKWAGSSCDYTQDQCCFLAPKDTSVRGYNQGGCKPGASNPQQGTCGRCTVTIEGGLCDAQHDICCDGSDPSHLLVCLDGVCVPAAPSAQD